MTYSSEERYYTGHWETQGILRLRPAKAQEGSIMTFSRRHDLFSLEGKVYKLNVWTVPTKIFSTYEEAVNDAQDRKQALLASCKKRIAKLEAHSFAPSLPEQTQQ